MKILKYSKELGADCIEIHTGKLANLVKSKKKYLKEFQKLKNVQSLADNLGIRSSCWSWFDYKTTKILIKIKQIKEFNIGHFIIGESIFFGLSKVIKNFKKIIKK